MNTRPRRALGCAPADRIGADRAAMLALPPVAPATGWCSSLRLPRDHYVRLDSNDYSVHPAVIGRRVLVRADLDRVQAFCGELVADHERIWAVHQTLSDPDHVQAAKVLRRNHISAARPSPSPMWRSGAWTTTTPRWVWISTAGWPDMPAKTTTSARDVSSEISYLTRALKAPTLRESAARLAQRARAENWIRGIPGGLPATRSVGPRIPRR